MIKHIILGGLNRLETRICIGLKLLRVKTCLFFLSGIVEKMERILLTVNSCVAWFLPTVYWPATTAIYPWEHLQTTNASEKYAQHVCTRLAKDDSLSWLGNSIWVTYLLMWIIVPIFHFPTCRRRTRTPLKWMRKRVLISVWSSLGLKKELSILVCPLVGWRSARSPLGCGRSTNCIVSAVGSEGEWDHYRRLCGFSIHGAVHHKVDTGRYHLQRWETGARKFTGHSAWAREPCTWLTHTHTDRPVAHSTIWKMGQNVSSYTFEKHPYNSCTPWQRRHHWLRLWPQPEQNWLQSLNKLRKQRSVMPHLPYGGSARGVSYLQGIGNCQPTPFWMISDRPEWGIAAWAHSASHGVVSAFWWFSPLFTAAWMCSGGTKGLHASLLCLRGAANAPPCETNPHWCGGFRLRWLLSSSVATMMPK